MSNVVTEDIFDKEPGMGINANPFEGEMYIDLTGSMGSLSGLYYGLMFALRRFGFETLKIDEWIDVTPIFKAYYDLTIQQRAALEAQIKSGLGQIATAIHDYELIRHDLRKYREYLDYFTKIEQGQELKKKAKTKEEKEKAEQMIKEGMQLLRSVFIDQVDAHTGEGIALRTITPRWPTIIVDFQRLDDTDVDPKKIAERYGITEAEGAVLATKNKLFIEWRDKLFRPTLTERYQNILRLVEARRTSIKQYTEMLKPIIARFKLINDVLQSPGARIAAARTLFQPGAQAYSMDFTRIWAFLPFAPAEKYKVTREYLDEIPLSKAGFRKHEIEQLIKAGKVEDAKEKVKALPVEPSIDDIVRRYTPKVEKHYGVKITLADVFEARKRLENMFQSRTMEVLGGKAPGEPAGMPGGIAAGATWMFSPYFVFLDLPFLRFVYRSPAGTEFEDLTVNNLIVKNRTQNVIIVTILEVIAREKQFENYVRQLLGEIGGAEMDLKTIEEIAKEEYPEFFGVARKEEKIKPEAKDFIKVLTTVKSVFGDLLKSLGLSFDWLRARGPYEFAMEDRIAEMFQVETMVQGYLYVLRYLQRGVGVPGVRL